MPTQWGPRESTTDIIYTLWSQKTKEHWIQEGPILTYICLQGSGKQICVLANPSSWALHPKGAALLFCFPPHLVSCVVWSDHATIWGAGFACFLGKLCFGELVSNWVQSTWKNYNFQGGFPVTTVQKSGWDFLWQPSVRRGWSLFNNSWFSDLDSLRWALHYLKSLFTTAKQVSSIF